MKIKYIYRVPGKSSGEEFRERVPMGAKSLALTLKGIRHDDHHDERYDERYDERHIIILLYHYIIISLYYYTIMLLYCILYKLHDSYFVILV